MPRRGTRLVCVVVAAVLLALSGTAHAWGPPKDPTGVWRSPDTSEGTGLIAKIDRAGIGVWNMITFPTEGNPLQARQSPYVGSVRRTGPATFEYSIMRYWKDEEGLIVYIVVLSGSFNIFDDGTAGGLYWAAYYSPDQDPFSGELPDFGCFGPLGSDAEGGGMIRVTPAPPCEP